MLNVSGIVTTYRLPGPGGSTELLAALAAQDRLLEAALGGARCTTALLESDVPGAERGPWSAPVRVRGRLVAVVAVQPPSPPREPTPVEQAVLALGAELARQTIERELEARETGEQLRRWRTNETLGRLALAVAHDFNNLLSVIQGEASIALDGVDDVETRDSVEMVLEAAARGTDLTRRLLDFGRTTAAERSALDLDEVVGGSVALVGRLLPRSISLAVELDGALPPVFGVRVELEQLLLNLALNARDAMPEGGELHIATRRGGGEVRLVVRDTGSGMDEETRRHVLEPFFTTKEPGAGTGLGLAIVADVVERHRGRLTIESVRGEGSTFVVSLPVACEATRAEYRLCA
jgi:signal transduction histidine kinase